MRYLTIFAVVFLLALFALGLFGNGEGKAKRGVKTERISIAAATPAPPATPVQSATPVPTHTFAQWQLRADEIPYDTLLRSADQYKGKLVYYRGEVGYVTGTRDQAEIKVRVKDRGLSWDRDSEVLVYYRNPAMKVFEGDIVEFVGKVDGYYPFNPIPAVVAIALEIERD